MNIQKIAGLYDGENNRFLGIRVFAEESIFDLGIKALEEEGLAYFKSYKNERIELWKLGDSYASFYEVKIGHYLEDLSEDTLVIHQILDSLHKFAKVLILKKEVVEIFKSKRAD